MNKRGKLFLKNPHTYVLLFCMLILVTVTTYIIPAGEYDMAEDPDTGRMVAIAGTYHRVEQTPVGPFQMVVAVQKGMVEAADIIFLIFFAYGALAVLTRTGAFYGGIGALLCVFGERDKLLFLVVIVVCGLASSTFGLWEEVYCLIPAFVAIAIAMGYDGLTGGAALVLGIGTGFAAALTNPFTIGIAQSIAKVPINSGIAYRAVIWLCYMAVTVWYFMRYAGRVKKNPELSLVKDIKFASNENMDRDYLMALPFTARHKLSVLLFAVTVAALINGTLRLGWYLDEMAGLFLILMIAIGLVGGMAPREIADTFIKACGDMAFGALIVGLARSLAIVMTEGRIIHSIVYGLSGAVQGFGLYTAAIGMLVVQNIINFFIPSGSGQAAATMPIMAPLADSLGLERQIAVLAYQFGDGFSNLFWPTAVATECGIMGIPIDRWYRFIAPLFGIWFAMQVAFMLISVMIGYH